MKFTPCLRSHYAEQVSDQASRDGCALKTPARDGLTILDCDAFPGEPYQKKADFLVFVESPPETAGVVVELKSGKGA